MLSAELTALAQDVDLLRVINRVMTMMLNSKAVKISKIAYLSMNSSMRHSWAAERPSRAAIRSGKERSKGRGFVRSNEFRRPLLFLQIAPSPCF
jgi:hypothetical protein